MYLRAMDKIQKNRINFGIIEKKENRLRFRSNIPFTSPRICILTKMPAATYLEAIVEYYHINKHV